MAITYRFGAETLTPVLSGRVAPAARQRVKSRKTSLRSGCSPANKGQRFPAEPLSQEEVGLLLVTCPPSPVGLRNRALLVVLYRAGLRISEALGLYSKDVDRTAGTLRVMHGKGNKSRVVGMDAEAFNVLTAWLDVRASLGHNGGSPVFCSLGGTRLFTAYVRAMLPRLARRAGIEKRVHAHGLRHTMASELRKEGVDIGVISKQLGHASIATTARYLDHIAPTAVVDAMRSRKWGVK